MTAPIAPLLAVLFLVTAIVLAGFTLYVSKAGKIRGLYTLLAGALLALIFFILMLSLTGNMTLASALGIIIFGWFYAINRLMHIKK